MKGSLDEVQIFNRALTSAEINSIYAAAHGGFVQVPFFTAKSFVGPTSFQLTAQGLTAKTISVYRSTDLSAWTKLSTVSNPSGTITNTDTHATNAVQFYRLSQP
jgi:hypothetical protein